MSRWAGKGAEEQPLPAGGGTVPAGDDPRRRALEDVQPADPWLDLRHDLDGGRPRADHRHALALEGMVVVPAGGVEDCPLEAVYSLDVGQLGLAQRARPGDQHVGRQLAAGRLDAPPLDVGLPSRRGDLVAVADVSIDVMLAGDAAQVVPYLRLGRVRPAPVWVGCERERVEVRGDVAGAARVGVVAPGAPQYPRPAQARRSPRCPPA